MEKTSSRQRRTEASSEGALGPEEAVAPQKDGHVLDRISPSSGPYKLKQQVQYSYM
jgi:hypothetical protein